jgi:IPT/TIG domain/Bacterial Ig-like domain (group 2)
MARRLSLRSRFTARSSGNQRIASPLRVAARLAGWLGWMFLAAATALAAPTITSVTPSSGPQSGNTNITINGANFVSGAKVTIGGQPASSVTFVSSTQLTAVTPPSPTSGSATLTVTNPDGSSATLSGSTQLLANPSFELGSVDWKTNGSGTATVQNNSANAHAGAWYADLIAPSGAHPALFAANSSGVPVYFPVTPGNVLTFGGWAYRVSGNGLGRFSIEVTDINKANPTYVQASPVNVTTAAWTQMTATYTVPAGKAFVRFYPELFSTTTTSEVRFDDANLSLGGGGGFKYNPAPSLSTVSPNAGGLAGGTVVTLTGANFASGATVKFGGVPATAVTFVSSTTLKATTPARATTGSVAVVVTNPDGQRGAFGPPTVLVTNPGFESGITNWALTGGGTATVKTGSTLAHSGSNYMEVTSASGNHPQVFNANSSNQQVYSAVQPGDLITFGGWAARVSGDGSARWNLVSYDANKANPNFPHPFPNNVTSGKWADQFGTYIVPAGRAFVSIYTEIYANTVSADARFDDGFLTRQTGGFTYSSTTPTLTSISVTPSSPSIGVGSAVQFTATGHYSDNSTQDLTTLATWSSSNTLVATISNTAGSQGQATGVRAGSTTITASYQGLNGNTTLTVTSSSTLTGFFTYQADNQRTGQVLNETTLTTSNVNATSFAKRFSFALDGWAFGQPLYAANVAVNGGSAKNVVYVATMHDSVYAFDADGLQTAFYWRRNFLSSGVTTVPMSDVGHANLYPEIGIVSTPVIDPVSQTIYVVAATKEPGPTYVWRLHALSLKDGTDKFGGSAVISATGFNAQVQMNRPALLLSNGVVYVAFGSYQDVGTYHGWLFAFSASTLQQLAVLNTSRTGSAGAIWMSGSGPAIDASGNLFFSVGNGSYNTTNGNYGDSMLKVSLVNNSALAVGDYFTPYTQASMNTNDTDYGSGGVLVVPDQSTSIPHIALNGAKDGNVYVVNRDNMGHNHASDNNQAVQVLPIAGSCTEDCLFSSPAYWNGNVFMNASGLPLRAYKLSNSQLTGPASSSAHSMGYPGVTPIVSANGTSNGIVWVLERMDTSNNLELHAYNANNLSTELYNSQTNATRDAIGAGTRFSVPLVFNGRVYVPTQKALVVFGLP